MLDGAWGTMLQGYQLEEDDYRGERFKDHPRDVKGNNDMLVLTQPQIIEEVQRLYLEAGADILSTMHLNLFLPRFQIVFFFAQEHLRRRPHRPSC